MAAALTLALLLPGLAPAEPETKRLPNETLYMTVRREPNARGAGIRIEAPDSVQEVYSANLGRASLVLTGMQYKTCTITLVPRP